MLYWLWWAELKSLVPDEIERLRQQLRLRFDQLFWVPQIASDRVWLYRRDDRFHVFPEDCDSSAPQVLVNSSFPRPQWNPPPGIGEDRPNGRDAVPQLRRRGPQPTPYVHLRQEEEEASE
ncbi:hypothetical protein JVU11DRAFT_1095 [Chiua virens]|nr:hypothetical protein JVU11DRAFT_1095 [Chiua virens]